MIDFLAGLPAKLKTLTDRLTSTRAGYIDNLSGGAPPLGAYYTPTRAGYLDLLPTLGSVVKRIQSDEGTIPNAESYLDITITAVNTSKAFVYLRSTSEVYGVRVAIQSSSNVRISRFGSLDGSCVVAFTVVEFN